MQTRLDLWLKTHVEKLLRLTVRTSQGGGKNTIARGIAFQLIEALGVLEHQKIAAEMKDLDRPSRASLREHGVRFGAYHIYFPALVETGGAFAGLGAVGAEAGQRRPVGVVERAASPGSGRTSFPADKLLRSRHSGELAIGHAVSGCARRSGLKAGRSDPCQALAWREGSPESEPAAHSMAAASL